MRPVWWAFCQSVCTFSVALSLSAAAQSPSPRADVPRTPCRGAALTLTRMGLDWNHGRIWRQIPKMTGKGPSTTPSPHGTCRPWGDDTNVAQPVAQQMSQKDSRRNGSACPHVRVCSRWDIRTRSHHSPTAFLFSSLFTRLSIAVFHYYILFFSQRDHSFFSCTFILLNFID